MARALVWTAGLQGVTVVCLGAALVLSGEAPPPMSVPVPGTLPTGEVHGAQPASGETGAEIAAGPAAVTDPSSPHLATVPPDDPLGLVLHGTVGGGELPEYVFLSFRRAEDEEAKPVRVQVSDVGSYALAGLRAGVHRVECRADGFDPLDDEVELAPAPRVQRRDFVLPRALVIKVKLLTPDGKPLREAQLEAKLYTFRAEVKVHATEEPVPDDLPSVGRRNPPIPGVGRWRSGQDHWREKVMPKEYAGVVQLEKPPPVWLTAMMGATKLASTRLEPGQDEVTMTIALDAIRGGLGSFRLRLLDAETREPITKANVQFANAFGMRADENGVIEMGDQPPTSGSLSIWAEGYERYACAATIEAGKTTDLGDLLLQRPRTAKGTAVDAEGKPVQASIRGVDVQRGTVDVPVVVGPRVGSEKDGTFTMEGLGPRPYLLVAHTQGDEQMATAVVDGRDPPQDLHFRLQPTARVTVENALSGFETCTVTVTTPEGLPLWSEQFWPTSRRGPRLPPGIWRVTITGSHSRSYDLNVTGTQAVLQVP